MSNWLEIKAAYRPLADAIQQGRDPTAAWTGFRSAVDACAEKPPYHLQLFLDLLDEARGERPRSQVRILDHGCGGALTLLFLLANGYEGIHGVDIGGWCESFNAFLNDRLGLKGQRFFVYDGETLPFDDDYFDFVFSTQVVEHIHPDVLDSYYAEEGRTLAPGGMAYHQVPHRLVPYDSHTQTWLLHYLPRSLWLAILRRMGQDMTVPEGHLFLRWPWVHRKLVRRYLGHCEIRTMKRFMGLSDLSDYDGPKGLRRLLGQLLAIPVLGWLGRKLLANLVMLDTVSRVPAITASAEGPAAVRESDQR